MQGVIKSYDPGTGDGVLINEADLAETSTSRSTPSMVRCSGCLRQGQRVNFDLDADGQRHQSCRLGSEADMETPDLSEL